MDHLPDFLSHHWLLAGCMAVLILLWFVLERLGRGTVFSPQALTQLVNHAEGVIIDIRNAQDFSKGHIAQSINIPFSDLAGRLTQLARYGHRPMIVVCQTGATASSATQMLKQAGHAQVGKLDGGIQRWRQDGLPLIQD